jgi:hypothetical protein
MEEKARTEPTREEVLRKLAEGAQGKDLTMEEIALLTREEAATQFYVEVQQFKSELIARMIAAGWTYVNARNYINETLASLIAEKEEEEQEEE